MKRRKSIIWLAGMAVLLTACSSQETKNAEEEARKIAGTQGAGPVAEVYQTISQIDPLSPPEQGAVSEDQQLRKERIEAAVRLVKSAFAQYDDKNIMLSPLGADFALAAVAEGAAGESREQLFTLLGVEDSEVFRRQNRDLKRYIDQEDKRGDTNSKGDIDSIVKLRDSIWIDDEMADVQNTFLQRTQEDHFCEVFRGDLQNPKTHQVVEQWGEQATDGVLRPQIKPDGDLRLLLLSTVYLKADWVCLFEKDRQKQEQFETSDGEVTLDFIHYSDTFDQMYDRGRYRMAQLPLASGMAFRVLLPDEGTDLEDLVQGYWGEIICRDLLTADFGDSSRGRVAEPAQISWMVPELSLTGESDLRSIIENAGYDRLFGEKSSYSGISDQAFPGQFEQKNHLSLTFENVKVIDREKKVIECLTGPELGPKVDMRLNRPFIYEIVSSNGLPLLVGIVADPIAQ